MPVPDSGVPAALGYAEKSNKKFELGLIKSLCWSNFYRTTQSIRSLGVKLKLSSTKTIVKNKSIILIDDSLVRALRHKIVKCFMKAELKKFMYV